jgi:hypothetical protein
MGNGMVARVSGAHGEAAFRVTTEAYREDSHGEGAAASRHPSGGVEWQHRTDEQRRGGQQRRVRDFEGCGAA